MSTALTAGSGSGFYWSAADSDLTVHEKVEGGPQHLAELIEGWAGDGTWRHRTPSDRESDQVAISQPAAECLLGLQQHYDLIVYVGFAFWRKMIFLVSSKSHGATPPLKKRSSGGPVVSRPAHLGSIGALHRLHCFIPRDFLCHRLKVNSDSVQRLGCGITHFGDYFFNSVRNNQKDVVSILIKELLVDVQDPWHSRRGGGEETFPLHLAITARSPDLLLLLGRHGGHEHLPTHKIDSLILEEASQARLELLKVLLSLRYPPLERDEGFDCSSSRMMAGTRHEIRIGKIPAERIHALRAAALSSSSSGYPSMKMLKFLDNQPLW